MSPKVDQGLSQAQLRKAISDAGGVDLREVAQQPNRVAIFKQLAKAGLLDSDAKNWLKAKHPDLYQAIANIDATGGKPAASDPFANYPAGTRYAVIDKNEL